MKKYLILVGGILLILLLIALQTGDTPTIGGDPLFQSIPSNTYTEFQGEFEFILLDLRTPAEFNEFHLPSARNLDFYNPSFREQLALLDRDQTYVIYCRTGSRSKATLTIMRELGFTSVFELNEGIVGCC